MILTNHCWLSTATVLHLEWLDRSRLRRGRLDGNGKDGRQSCVTEAEGCPSMPHRSGAAAGADKFILPVVYASIICINRIFMYESV